MTDLTDQVAVVTGASSGLGRRFATVLHGAGATVVVAARRRDRLVGLADELGGRVEVVPCDIAEDDQRAALIQTVLDRFGRIDVLVNNAGIGVVEPAEDEPISSFRRSLEVNVVAPFHLAQLTGRSMLERDSGSIVNIASMFGLVASAPIRQAGYCTSKGAVVNMTRELAAQWASRGVRVNAIAPGWFESEMNEAMWTDERSLAFVRRGTPLRRQGQAGELDAVLLLLAGPGGTYIHGQTITVDGGWTIT